MYISMCIDVWCTWMCTYVWCIEYVDVYGDLYVSMVYGVCGCIWVYVYGCIVDVDVRVDVYIMVYGVCECICERVHVNGVWSMWIYMWMCMCVFVYVYVLSSVMVGQDGSVRPPFW